MNLELMVYQHLIIKIGNNFIKFINNLKTSSFYKNKERIYLYIILRLNFYVLYYTHTCKPNSWFTRTSSQAQSCHDTSNQNNQSELGLMRHSSWQHNKKKVLL